MNMDCDIIFEIFPQRLNTEKMSLASTKAPKNISALNSRIVGVDSCAQNSTQYSGHYTIVNGRLHVCYAIKQKKETIDNPLLIRNRSV